MILGFFVFYMIAGDDQKWQYLPYGLALCLLSVAYLVFYGFVVLSQKKKQHGTTGTKEE